MNQYSVSLVLFLTLVMPVTVYAKTCGPSINWCVFTNKTVSPHLLGVANGVYHAPGWQYHRGPWQEPWKAWRDACRWHNSPAYHSPDIEAGHIDCAACAQGPEGCAK